MYECLGKYLINTFRDLNYRLHIQTKVLIVLYQNYPGRIKNCKFLIFKNRLNLSKNISIYEFKNYENNFHNYFFLIIPIFEEIYFIKLQPMFVNSLYTFGKRYEKKLKFIFNQWPKLYLKVSKNRNYFFEAIVSPKKPTKFF